MSTENNSNISRKRKQDVLMNNWSDYIFTAPQPSYYSMDSHPHSRRHSVAVGELYSNNSELDQIYNSFNWPTSTTTIATATTATPTTNTILTSQTNNSAFPHRRAMSLRLDNFNQQSLLDLQQQPAPSSLFNSSYLDTLKHDNTNHFDFMLNNDHDSLTNWLLDNKSSSKNVTTSPPIYQHPSIPEEDEDDTVEDSVISNRVLQAETNVSIMKPLIEKYILNQFENERKITIFTSKVAQKSYGTEKRFLCPPPTTVLSGNWFIQQQQPTLTVHISGEKTFQNGLIEWQPAKGLCVSKHLHINDADEKRKRVEILVKTVLGNGIQLGTLASKPIKVISKPSKKRQSVKNMELCIHHGTTVSLFNRVRSQTVSTKYLGVSSAENGTCFVARTNTWDPFVIWLVDTTRSPDQPSSPPSHDSTIVPPAIALKQQQPHPIPIHYNQPVVLQCISTGLVSPVMVIRKVDKGSMVLGGNRLDDLSGTTGGECGDEALGDPVSQLHKVAFQIVHDPSIAHFNKTTHQPTVSLNWELPQITQSVTYLACLDNVVGMHKTTSERHLVSSRPQSFSNDLMQVFQHEGNKRKRRVSYDASGKNTTSVRRRVSSVSDELLSNGAGRRNSSSSENNYSDSNGACWTEDVSDASIWTIVGTDSVSYKFWTPPGMLDLNSPFTSTNNASMITPIPILSKIQSHHQLLVITGENFTKDISVWFGDIRAKTEHKSRESISCQVPDIKELMASSTCVQTNLQYKIPLLFVRGDGIVYNTDSFYFF